MKKSWILAGAVTLAAAMAAAPLAWARQRAEQRETSPLAALEKLRQLP